MEKSVYVQAKNALHPGYGECAKCGGNWGWKKSATHPTKVDENGNMTRGIFLFCEDCDKTVTLQERWEALDQWKADCIRQIGTYYKTDSAREVLDAVRDIMQTEYIEFSRSLYYPLPPRVLRRLK